MCYKQEVSNEEGKGIYFSSLTVRIPYLLGCYLKTSHNPDFPNACKANVIAISL